MQVTKFELSKKKMVETEVKENMYTFTFTENELATIMMILAEVAGSPTDSRRKHISTFFNTLDVVGFSLTKMNDQYDPSKLINTGAIYFEDEKVD